MSSSVRRATLIQRESDRDLAHLRLQQLLDLPSGQPLELTTVLHDSALARTPSLAPLLAAARRGALATDDPELVALVDRELGKVRLGQGRLDDARELLQQARSALEALGWNPQRTPAESVAEYADWLRGMPGLDAVLADADATMKSLGVVRESDG